MSNTKEAVDTVVEDYDDEEEEAVSNGVDDEDVEQEDEDSDEGEDEDDGEAVEDDEEAEGTPPKKKAAKRSEEDSQSKSGEGPGGEAPTPIDWRKWRQGAEGEIKKRFALDDAAAAKLEDNPKEAIPELLASVYMDSVEAAVRGVVNMLPQVVHGMIQGNNNSVQLEQRFYKEWPTLRKYHSDVLKVARIYRQTYPEASVKETIKDVGLQVSAMKDLGKQVPRPAKKGLRSGAGSKEVRRSQVDDIDKSLADEGWG